MGPVFAAFILGVVVSALVNILTALFNRERGIRLVPWMVLYVTIHGLYVLLETDPVRGFVMAEARRYHGLPSYLFVMVVAAFLAALYWKVLQVGAVALDKATAHATQAPLPAQPVPPASAPSEIQGPHMERPATHNQRLARPAEDEFPPSRQGKITEQAPHIVATYARTRYAHIIETGSFGYGVPDIRQLQIDDDVSRAQLPQEKRLSVLLAAFWNEPSDNSRDAKDVVASIVEKGRKEQFVPRVGLWLDAASRRVDLPVGTERYVAVAFFSDQFTVLLSDEREGPDKKIMQWFLARYVDLYGGRKPLSPPPLKFAIKLSERGRLIAEAEYELSFAVEPRLRLITEGKH